MISRHDGATKVGLAYPQRFRGSRSQRLSVYIRRAIPMLFSLWKHVSTADHLLLCEIFFDSNLFSTPTAVLKYVLQESTLVALYSPIDHW